MPRLISTNWETDKMLDVYIHDYLVKKQLHATAKTFQAEGNVSKDPVVIDAPGGFLSEWWTVFWDIYIARHYEKHSEEAAFYLKTQQIKAREMRKQEEQELLNPNQNQQMQMQLLLQRHAQQQQRGGGTQVVSGSPSCPIRIDPLMRQNQATTNAMGAKIYEDRSKPPLQRNALDDVNIKQKEADNVSHLLKPNDAKLLKAVAAITGRQATRQTLLSAASILQGNIQQVQNQNQQLPVSTQGRKSDMNVMMKSQAVVPEGSFINVHGSNQVGSDLTLKGWPLPALDQLCPGLLQQNNLFQSPQSFNQVCKRLRTLLNNQNMGDSIPNIGIPAQTGSPILPRPDSDILLKQQAQNQHLQQYSQHPLSSQQSESLQQQEKIGSGGMAVDGSVFSTLQGNDQASKSQIGRKRKPTSSPGPANSSRTANTTGPSTGSPSTPSTQTPADVMTVPTLQQNVPSSKSLPVFDADGLGSLTSTQNQLADMDHLQGDGSLGDNVESFLYPDDTDHRGRVGKGFSFKEIKHIMASSHKVECCHFSSDGKLFVTGGHDKKVSLWCTESFNLKSTLEEHTQWITDVRFCPSMLRVATSSADKTVRVWDADNPGYSLRTFTGHATTVMSLDFHPIKDDLICSCDNREIRYWSIKNGSCAGVFKIPSVTQLRFQPCLGRLLAAAVGNLVSILDVETLDCRLKLQGHNNLVRSVCWDSSGNYLASLSDDLVRIWKVESGSEGECIHELYASEMKFNTCAFHPEYPVLVIGCHGSLELWDFSGNKIMTLHPHDSLVSALAVSNATGLVASASHDKYFKIWK